MTREGGQAQRNVLDFFMRPFPGFEKGREEVFAAREKPLTESDLGRKIGWKGIFIGTLRPEGALEKVFNVFAAPEDLTRELKRENPVVFEDMVISVATLNGWHGHNGIRLDNEKAVYEALKSDAYNGEWFIPTQDMIATLYEMRGKSDLKNTFAHLAKDNRTLSYYLSCTEKPDNPSMVVEISFYNGNKGFCLKDAGESYCRPVRAERRPLPR